MASCAVVVPVLEWEVVGPPNDGGGGGVAVLAGALYVVKPCAVGGQ